MADYEYQSPGFTAEGVEPPASLKSDGFEVGYKPPAPYFNWFWTRVSRCITELQTKLSGAAVKDLSNVDNAAFRSKSAAAGAGGIQVVSASSSDGVAYTAKMTGVTALTNGLTLTIIPEISSTSTAPTLNVNGLGAIPVRLPLSFNTAAVTMPKLANFFGAGRPVTVQYDANYVSGGVWKTLDKQKTSAQDLYGSVPIASGGTGADTAAGARTNLGIADYIYPVGSIYMSVNNTSPATLFGGTWEQIKDTFLLSAGDTYAPGATGGEAKHTLTTDEIPPHSHYAYKNTNADNDWGFMAVKREGNARTQVATSSSSGKYAITNGTSSYLDWPYYTRTDVGSRTSGTTAHNNMPPYLAVYVWKRTA